MKDQISTEVMPDTKSLPLSGLRMRNKRNEISIMAEKRSAKVQDSIGKTTNYLVIGQNVGQTKLNAATTKGVTIITEGEYLKMINA